MWAWYAALSISTSPSLAQVVNGLTTIVLIRDDRGLLVEGNPGGPGRPPGSKDLFPRNSYTAMKELIAGRIMKVMKDREGQEVQKSPAEIMADAILEGMQAN